MKIFPKDKIREWDAYTIQQHYRSSEELMESVAAAVVFELDVTVMAVGYAVFCGTGNNGGDGLCIARLLAEKEYEVEVFIIGKTEEGSDDFLLNLKRIIETDIKVHFLSENNFAFSIASDVVIIDCIFGTGINRPIVGWFASLIENLNSLPNQIFAIDIPSGLQSDLVAPQCGAIIKAARTLTFETPKLAFMFKENYQYIGEFSIAPIGLDTDFHIAQYSDVIYYEESEVRNDFIPREKFSHKSNFGHINILAGSKGKIGAAVLCAHAAMRSGAGLVTVSIPACGLEIMQTSFPEAMCEVDTSNDVLSSISYDNKYSVTAIGPGIGQAPETVLMLRRILKDADAPLVLDADALNIIASKNLINDVPKNSIMTPHVGEFDRLFGRHDNSFERFITLKKKAMEHQLVIILKGAHTAVASPDGVVSFNSTGNVGMATAGSGDVLTGVIASLFGQGYSPAVAARLGVYLHGYAGDVASETKSFESVIASDLINSLPDAFAYIYDELIDD